MAEIKMMQCGECGKAIPRTTHRRKYCVECARFRKLRAAQESAARVKEARLSAKRAAEAEKEACAARINTLTLAGKSANRITAEANAFGMSYGTYSAAVRDGSIESILRHKGFADPEAVLRGLDIK